MNKEEKIEKDLTNKELAGLIISASLLLLNVISFIIFLLFIINYFTGLDFNINFISEVLLALIPILIITNIIINSRTFLSGTLFLSTFVSANIILILVMIVFYT